MAVSIQLLQMGPSMTEGKIVHWKKKEGEAINLGEPIVEIETDKSIVEIEAPAAGILDHISREEGSIVAVGEELCSIRLPDETPQEDKTGSRGMLVAGRSDGSAKVSPLARRIASELGVNLSGVKGSGPGGRIVEDDIRRAAEIGKINNTTEPVSVRGASGAFELVKPPTPMTGIRALIANRMQTSHQTTAPVTLTAEADATALVELRDQLKIEMGKELGFSLGYNEILIKIVAKSIEEFPYMNARFEDDFIRIIPEINIGLAVDTDRGLLAVVVKNSNRKSLAEISREVHDLTDKARNGTILPEELVSGTFTITNLGMYDIDAFTPIINLPEAAILGLGQIKPRPFVIAGQLVVRNTVWLSLTFDHRVVDGAPAGRFLKQIKQLIQIPGLFIKG